MFHRLATCLALSLLASCVPDFPSAPSSIQLPVGAGVDAPCADTVCRSGLTCAPDSRVCRPVGNKAAGAACLLSEECQAGQHCNLFASCAPSGAGVSGAQCYTEGDCGPGLVCNLTGIAGACAPAGAGDIGAACRLTSDCRGGLLCAVGACQPFLAVKPWAGASCPEEAERRPRILFHVPRDGEIGEDFYRLPFPNDIRKHDGRVSLTGHPRPGARLLPFDPVARIIEAIETDATGFGVNAAVYARFSRTPGAASLDRAGAITYQDITPGSPQYGQVIPHRATFTAARGRYICARSLAVRQDFGAPLRPATTYAVLFRRTITDETGAAMEPDDDFKVMLAASAPPELAAAWRAYAPLRAFIEARRLDAAELAAAAVFTTEDVEEPLAGLRQAVRLAAAPAIKTLVRCGDGRSPCEDGKTARGCGTIPQGYDEYQGLVTLPVFQKGTPPYEQPADGGGIELDAAGLPRLQRTEDVCFALTVPKGTPPRSGWPVVVYAHGTGGDYRSFIRDDWAAELAGSDAAVPMAVFGYDGVLHGPRGGGTDRPVTELVYNFLNPRAARDNALQAAADLFAIARALEGFTGLPLDRARMALYGHSQGGNAAAAAATREPAYGAVALSGTGGTLIYTLLHKRAPVDIPLLLPYALGDDRVDPNHPVLNLLQMYFDRADPVSFARRLFLEPAPGLAPKHVLHVYGTGDSFSPVETQRTFALAAGVAALTPVLDRYGLAETRAPGRGNRTMAGHPITAVQAQFQPAGYDGHFVSSSHPRGRRAIRQMLGTYMRDGIPTVDP